MGRISGFGDMKIKTKVALGSSLLMVVPVVVVSIVLGWVAVENGRQALEVKAGSQLVAQRDASKHAVEQYFKVAEAQAQTLSSSRMVVTAIKSIPRAYKNFRTNAGAAGNAGNAVLAEMKKNLAGYYSGEYATEYARQNGGKAVDTQATFDQLSEDAIVMQDAFIKKNSNPLGEKEKLDDPGDGSLYAVLHKRFRDYVQKFGYCDVFLVDAKEGNVVYSVYKELDFATSLKTGPYKESGLGQVFNAAMASEDGDSVVITDFAAYGPSYDDQAIFMASPIMDKGKILGVLIFQLPVDYLTQLMTHNHKWADVGLGATGEGYLVGSDLILRSDRRLLIEDPAGYDTAMQAAGASPDALAGIKAKKTSIGYDLVKTTATEQSIAGESGLARYMDHRGLEVLSAYAPMSLLGLKWGIVSEISVDEAFSAVEELKATITTMGILVSVIVLVLGGALGWVFGQLLVKPIEQTVEAIKDIAEGEGDLTQRLDDQRSDELGELAGWFNRFVNKLQSIITDLNTHTNDLSVSAEQMSRVSDDTNKGMADQQMQTEQAATAMNQMAATVHEVARNAEAAAAAASQARGEAGEGQRTVEESVNSIRQLSETVDRASGVIARLEQDSMEIGGVLDVIRNIAEQTNLLALNAAIEAARAGEQGRGFAVVADEVRTLASRTQKSTQEIQEMIERLQAASKEAVGAMGESTEQATTGTEYANKAGEVLQSITDSILQISDMNTQIASASEEQSQVAEEINRNVVGINQIGEHTAQGAKETASGSEALSRLAGQIKGLVGQFKV